jgi:hypothetical protein
MDNGVLKNILSHFSHLSPSSHFDLLRWRMEFCGARKQEAIIVSLLKRQVGGNKPTPSSRPGVAQPLLAVSAGQQAGSQQEEKEFEGQMGHIACFYK